MEIRVESRQGKGGKWRWFMIDIEGEVFKCMGSVRGFDTQIASDTDAMEVVSSMVSLAGSDMVAGGRVFYHR